MGLLLMRTAATETGVRHVQFEQSLWLHCSWICASVPHQLMTSLGTFLKSAQGRAPPSTAHARAQRLSCSHYASSYQGHH